MEHIYVGETVSIGGEQAKVLSLAHPDQIFVDFIGRPDELRFQWKRFSDIDPVTDKDAELAALREQLAEVERQRDALITQRNQRVRMKSRPDREGVTTVTPIVEVRWDGGAQVFVSVADIERIPEGDADHA